MSEGIWVLVAVLVLAVGFGGYRAYADGRFRTRRLRAAVPGPDAAAPEPEALTAAEVGGPLGERATLLQFSSAFCAPCRATRRILADVADVVPGVVHLEVDAESHLELVRRLGVRRTPTTLILGPDGVELSRASGAPRKETVLATLARSLG